MKANEIQIGDWLYYKGHFNAFPFKVESITKKKVGYHAEPNEHRIYYLRLSECKPIPLVPETLEKNGFEKQWQDNYEYFDDDENLNITFHPKNSNYTNGAYDYIDIEKGCLAINEMPIAFVHELQHALRLCGIDKNIEL